MPLTAKRVALVCGLIVLVVGFGAAIWLGAQTPSHAGNWQTGHARLAEVQLVGDGFELTNVRDFRYDADGNPIKANWTSADFSLNNVRRLWFGLSHFAERGVAHNLISFEFADGRYLALSVEARLEQGQSYDPLLGLLRQFEMIYVFGTEADLIGLRSHRRGEPLFLYPLDIPVEETQQLLRVVLAAAAQLNTNPVFYHTVLNNCLTHLLMLSGHFSWVDVVTDWRLIIPGYSYQVAAERGWLPLSNAAESHRSTPSPYRVDPTVSPDLPTFSAAIRSGCAQCEPYVLP